VRLIIFGDIVAFKGELLKEGMDVVLWPACQDDLEPIDTGGYIREALQKWSAAKRITGLVKCVYN